MTSVGTLRLILGPTAVGKTEYCIPLALKCGCPIVSCDSRQLFREMPVGTAAPTGEQLALVPHYFIGDRSVTERCTAGQYELEALALLEKLFAEHDTVIVTGGSGLYADALCFGLDEFPETDWTLRESLMQRLEDEGIGALRMELGKVDPVTYRSIDVANSQRIVRALEVFYMTGRPYSSFRTDSCRRRPFRMERVCITRPRDVLYDRINARVDAMFGQGLVDEARALLPYRHLPALQTVGYREVFEYLDGCITLERAVELVKRNTRHYAKRQLSWWRRAAERSRTQSPLEWVELD